MNRLIIVGNGFDLAHGLKTRYSDFIHYYRKLLIKKVLDRPFYYENRLCSVENNTKFNRPSDLEPLVEVHEIKNFAKSHGIVITPKNDFFKRLINSINFEQNWVDIEKHYYEQLMKPFLNNIIDYKKQIEELNLAFEELKNELVDYLKQQKFRGELSHYLLNRFCERLVDEPNPLYAMLKTNDVNNVRVLNFNYTDTIHQYISTINDPKVRQIQIHGSTNNKEHVIFGYGDELDKHYKIIEDMDDNLMFSHIKSFGYFQNKNYREVINFIEGDDFEVYVMGHSLGLSDRTMLNQIFESEKLREVTLFHYIKKDGSNDFVEKTHQISRHFNKKGRMRLKIVPFDKDHQMVC